MSEAARLPALVDAYLAELATTASPATVAAYRRDLAALLTFLEERREDRPATGTETPSVDELAGFDTKLLRRFLAAERARGLAPRSLARRRAAISGFANHLRAQGLLDHNPAALLRTPKRPDDPHFWDEPEAQLLGWLLFHHIR